MRPEILSLKEKLDPIFQSLPAQEAHVRAADLLRPLGKDASFLEAIILENTAKPGFFSKLRINPVLGFPIIETPDYQLICHVWLPLPDQSSALTHQSIHHHGNLLLTSLAAWGPGYESILFRSDWTHDRATLQANLTPEKFYRNPAGNLEFCSARAPHVVFYPKEISVTYALWSPQRKGVARGLKNLAVLRRYKEEIKSALVQVGLGSLFAVNPVSNMDFCVSQGKVELMQDRVTYQPGTNENFLRAFFYFLQNIPSVSKDGVRKLALSAPERDRAEPWLKQYLSDSPIPNIFEPHHLLVPRVNLSRSDVLACFPGLRELS